MMANRAGTAFLTAMAEGVNTLSRLYARKCRVGVSVVCIGLGCFGQNAFAQSPNTRVIAAANSTCESLEKAADIFVQRSNATFSFICKSSGSLAKGIRGGMISPDYFISASENWIDELVQSAHVSSTAVRQLWGNELVLAYPIKHPIDITTWDEVASDKITHLLIGDPGTAPFGRYAKQALQSAGLWERVKSKVGTRKHITMLADDLSAAQEGTAGILFATNLNDGLQAILHVPPEWHDPIRYFGASPIGKEDDPMIADFISFLNGPEAVAIFSNAGFRILP